ncbi:phosphoribosylformylglycinamidine synthase subunit PurS [Leptospira bandrabouensis]|uniref:Phosphoribosylformylglycinamidine synthase subunit PurS n=1 Tax=Leptospira bandrabouensis TaxID=2484903 RepID=A0A6H3NTG8_9LEPT|nr:phosphoribosylformylglycinamidine synthase subunit PurS [Leptospira bandrabouensis]MCG6144829.1 phosphoribosylformylglycinamidine synthase subunit PurS [Leptospira bandrabouensis]MCG6152844.1 phosphoribosylformylglycinamidine synthase subunit PurS [Leptospira bandrabouensis]MCG6160534.1 phosphoribosylformylglycinamidine synthase subunit PurS [Leptospira bandrabouensis]MCG6164466.1 phosphoribosylformylglycinamidine synthase subunit PurS [Leptospira bandrabouensis]TGN03651.1 phosphoribosylfor
MFVAKINVTLKESVLDPQGQTVLRTLHDQGKNSVADLRVGKYIEMKIDAKSQSEAEALAKEICESVLVNQVIETYRLVVEKV